MLDVLKIIGWLIMIIVGAFLFLLVFAGIVMFADGLGKRYVIYDGNISHYTDAYEEKDGCVYFTDNISNKYKLCGYYTIREREFQK